MENNALGSKSVEDIITKIDSVTKTLLIASIPSVIGFLSFLTTSYVGLAELGLISSIGLVVGFIMNVTLLPSLIIIFSKMALIKIMRE